MAKWAIIFDSKYGTTEQYMNWLAKKIDADLYKAKNVKPENLMGYETMIFACGIYNDKLSIIDIIKKNISHLMFKKIIVVGVGWYSQDDFNVKMLEDYNFTPEMQGRFPLFLLKGEINLKKINPMEAMTLKMTKNRLNKKFDRSNDDIVAISMIDGMNKYTAEENLDELVSFINEGKWKIRKQ